MTTSFGHLIAAGRPVVVRIALGDGHSGGERDERAPVLMGGVCQNGAQQQRHVESRAGRREPRCVPDVRGLRSALRPPRRCLRRRRPARARRRRRSSNPSGSSQCTRRATGPRRSSRCASTRPARPPGPPSTPEDGQAGSISKLMSMAGAECVSAPMETKSGPAGGDLGDPIQRDAARHFRLRPAAAASTASAMFAVVMLSSKQNIGSRGQRLIHLLERLDLDLDRQRSQPTLESASPPARLPPATAM